jgi:hypothetical protein
MSGNGENEGGGKSAGGHIAIAIAAIGAFIARGADDCGRVALKGGAALSDDAARGASRVGSLADDGMRGGSKVGSLADDGMRTSKFAPIADDGMRTRKIAPAAEPPGGLVEEATNAGAKAESHAGDVVEHGVDVSLEIVSNIDSSNEVGEEDAIPTQDNDTVAQVTATLDPITVLKNRSSVWQPALLPMMPTSPKAFAAIFGRPEKPTDKNAFGSLNPSPTTLADSLDKMDWLAHNPITLVFYSPDSSGKKNPIPLVMPNGDATTDSAIHRVCIQHASHCILLVCTPQSAAAKMPCAKAAVDTWQSVTANSKDLPLQTLLGNLVAGRASRIALESLTISRVDVATGTPRIVRSRLTPKAR